MPLLLLNDPGLREVTDRLYGGGSESGCARNCCWAWAGRCAVRAYCELTGHPRPEVFHTNEGHAAFSAWNRMRRSQGLSFEEAIELCAGNRRRGLHHAHPGARRGCRPGPGGAAATGTRRSPALPRDRVHALGAETYPGGGIPPFDVAVGMRLAQRVNGVEAARPGQPGMFAGPGSKPVKCRSARSPTACTRQAAHPRQEIVALAAGPAARIQRGPPQGGPGLGPGGRDRSGPAVGHPPHAAQADLVIEARQAAARVCGGADRPKPSWLDPPCAGRVADHPARPPGALVQAPDPDAARPGAADRAAAGPAAPGADRNRRQGASRRRRREAAHRSGQVRRDRGCGTASCSSPTTTCRWPGRWSRGVMCG